MAMLEMMYVYFDINGDIKTISPDPVIVSDSYTVATFPLSEVKDILEGNKNPFDFYVKSSKGIGGTTHKITRKQVLEVSYVRTLDNFLTEVGTMKKSADAFVLIENFTKEKKIKISLNAVVKMLLNEGDDKDQETVTSFINNPSTSLFFTRKKDPYFLLHTLIFSPRELFEKSELFWDYNVDLSASSVYTKKLLDGYSYRIR
jgi:hypothetical protein